MNKMETTNTIVEIPEEKVKMITLTMLSSRSVNPGDNMLFMVNTLDNDHNPVGDVPVQLYAYYFKTSNRAVKLGKPVITDKCGKAIIKVKAPNNKRLVGREMLLNAVVIPNNNIKKKKRIKPEV